LMEGLGLLVGHLLGDYILQDDWQAANKTAPAPKPWPWQADEGGGHYVGLSDDESAAWKTARRKWRVGHLACTLHCLLYTLAVWSCSFWWMPWWGLLMCFLAHWPVDRFRLARKWMSLRQEQFATGVFSPWSIIVVDNTIHLLVLFAIGLAAGVR
jgi:hypothetical protein